MQSKNPSPYITFLRRLILFSFILGIIALAVRLLAPPRFVTPALPGIFFFFISITLTGYFLILRTAKEKFIRFLNSYMLVTVVKLMVYVGVIFLYLANNRPDAAAFAITFFLLYLCYTIFEVVNLVGYFKSTRE